MFTMMMNAQTVDSIRERLIANNTQERKIRKSFVNPFTFAGLSRSSNDYYSVNGVLMPR